MSGMDSLSISARQDPAGGGHGGLKLVFKGSGVKHLLNSGRKQRPRGWRQFGGSEQQGGASPSQGEVPLSESPGHPFSPSSNEPSPKPDPAAAAAAAAAAHEAWAAGPRSVHGQPPGKQPYPDDQTPEAEAVRAQQLHPQGDAALPRGTTAAALAPAGPRSVHGQPPGKQPHPDDPSFRGGGAAVLQQPASPQQRAGGPGQPLSPEEVNGAGADTVPGPKSVYGQPPGKNADQIYQIAASAQVEDEEDEVAEPSLPLHHPHHPHEPLPHPHAAMGQPPQAAAARPSPQPPWRRQQQHGAAAPAAQSPPPQQQHGATPAAPQLRPQQQPGVGPAGAAQAHMPAPAASSHQGRQRTQPGAPGSSAAMAGHGDKPSSSRKRPASQSGAEGWQRKKPANGAAAGGAGAGAGPGQGPPGMQRAPTGASAPRTGVPLSLARTGSLHSSDMPPPPQQIRPMPGAPRSLQQRQQLVNGATVGGGPGAAAPRPAGASRPKQPSSTSKPKQQARPAGASASAAAGQKRPGSGGAAAAGGGAALGTAAAAAAAGAQQYGAGDVVWAKIGVYPWWPAQLQRPTADEHFKPKHAATDLFCVFYGSNDYNWLPATQLKPFTDTHPDYAKHASVKNKALQRAIDEAWVYGVQRQRPDVNYGPAYGGA